MTVVHFVEREAAGAAAAVVGAVVVMVVVVRHGCTVGMERKSGVKDKRGEKGR